MEKSKHLKFWLKPAQTNLTIAISNFKRMKVGDPVYRILCQVFL